MGSEHELEEAAEKAREPFDRVVGATMATVAVVLALVSVLGQMKTTEELLAQQKASDQWAYYQAKSIRRYQSEFAGDVLRVLPGPAAAAAGKKYDANVERYKSDGEEIQRKARELEEESKAEGHRALGLHFAEIFLEVAIVFCSLTYFWLAGVVLTVVGAVIALRVFLVH